MNISYSIRSKTTDNFQYIVFYCHLKNVVLELQIFKSIFSTHFRILTLFALYSQFRWNFILVLPKKHFKLPGICKQKPIDLIMNTATTIDILPERMNHVDFNNTLDPKTTIFSPAAVSWKQSDLTLSVIGSSAHNVLCLWTPSWAVDV